ncbi:MAG TPA: hypothetical protein DCE44_06675 [Verrucomicrobiales bacterium]|nr:hypothetical protein [Verrucomicrobiales bacterium]
MPFGFPRCFQVIGLEAIVFASQHVGEKGSQYEIINRLAPQNTRRLALRPPTNAPVGILRIRANEAVGAPKRDH